MSSVVAISRGGRSITVCDQSIFPRCGTDIVAQDILSAAMDSGVAVAIILIYFCLQYPQNGTIGQNTIQTWWGNTVFKNTADYNYTSYYRTNGTFGYVQRILHRNISC